ncbi:hypothetical protein CLU79DRAFT_832879 [Phycomyces nitens]|nr:hypothetical protein CLU79DRAFT_832879 [Phycomyces nitens]
MTFERISSQSAVAALLATEIYPRSVGFSPAYEHHPRHPSPGVKRQHCRPNISIFSAKRSSRDSFQVLSRKAWVARLPTLVEEDTPKRARTDDTTDHPISHHPVTTVSIHQRRLVDQPHYSPALYLARSRPRFQSLRILLDNQSRHSSLSNQTWLNTLGPRLSTIKEE